MTDGEKVKRSTVHCMLKRNFEKNWRNELTRNIPENKIYALVVKAKTKAEVLKAKSKARALKAEANAKDMIFCPRGRGLSSRTTSLF